MRVYLYILILISTIVAITFAATAYPQNFKLFDIRYSELTKEAKQQVACLAENIYYEAGYEPEDGKLAVALVTLNRTQSPKFPNNICGVVKQKTNSTCQFTWFCEPMRLNRNNIAYEKAMDVALFAYANYEVIDDITKGALYYHADYVNPRWKLQRTTIIGRHIFYKEGGIHNDGKTKPVSKRGQFEALVLSLNGGSDS